MKSIFKKIPTQYFLGIDTETTKSGKVCDLGLVITDKKGRIHATHGILIDETSDEIPFWTNGSPDWSYHKAKRNHKRNQKMYYDGERCRMTVKAVNNLLEFLLNTYNNPTIYAFNIAFDWKACKNTGIDLTIFPYRFDLMAVMKENVFSSPDYQKWAVENDYVTERGNVKYSADAFAHYIMPNLPPEPHTALEDVMNYEAILLAYVIQSLNLTRSKILGYSQNSKAEWTKGATLTRPYNV